MTVKKVQKRTRPNLRHRKASGVVSEGRVVKNDEAALRRQLLVIKKDYSKLMDDVATGYGLLKHWVNIQKNNRGELLKMRFNRN